MIHFLSKRKFSALLKARPFKRLHIWTRKMSNSEIVVATECVG